MRASSVGALIASTDLERFCDEAITGVRSFTGRIELKSV
jgi:hypothetical protein